ncbi:hypothetical protein DFH08DRAFT_917801 [Mycena albidolilacea]|uniref:Helitron helicase-like domain-containing protein n=1 Tax=Mycena albidolilacea TaxID=1033008 RepID=A0AAD7EDB8_9AGAR|nr:hypothetical protein DFH08DRAFT_917801 [Mycena albidolilacea]
MVEAQGRGMLHCHFLIWLDRNPNPQKLRDLLSQDGNSHADMFKWLEETIKYVRFEHPPRVDNYSSDPKPSTLYTEQVTRLVKEYNWHEHRETCWKHLRSGDPHDDTTCRMRMNGVTSAETQVDSESGSIILKRLHPRISNYNEVLAFLLRSNVDVKYVVQALVYYITDYVTKSELPVHARLAAIEAAMQKTELQYENQTISADSCGKNLLIKSLNAIMARTELSHQQVMSYLVGGGDVYRSHEFRTMIWNDVEEYLKLKESAETIPDAVGETPVTFQGEEMVNISVDSDSSKVSTSNDVQDYALRDP